jgi:hypothetical protein
MSELRAVKNTSYLARANSKELFTKTAAMHELPTAGGFLEQNSL